MKDAWQQYIKRSTTFAETQIDKPKMDPPVLILCPDPPYKPSFFKSCITIIFSIPNINAVFISEDEKL